MRRGSEGRGDVVLEMCIAMRGYTVPLEKKRRKSD
jgi:hypothetical protein